MDQTTLSASIRKMEAASDDVTKIRDVYMEQFPVIFNRQIIEETQKQVPKQAKIPKIFNPQLKTPRSKLGQIMYSPPQSMLSPRDSSLSRNFTHKYSASSLRKPTGAFLAKLSVASSPKPSTQEFGSAQNIDYDQFLRMQSASPSNFDIIKSIKEQSSKQIFELKDFSQQNIVNLKEFKIGQIESSKISIEQIHSRLRQQKNVASLLHLDDIVQHLPARLQPIFLNMPFHDQILKDITALNISFLPVCDYLVCFKPEIGLLFQRLVESYNILFLEQFEGFYKNENYKEVRNQEMELALNRFEQAIQTQKHDLYTQQDMVRALMFDKDQEIEDLRSRVELQRKETLDLQKILVESRAPLQVDEAKQLERQRKQREIKGDDELSDDGDVSPGEFDQYRIQRIMFNNDVEDYKAAADNRLTNLSNLDKIVTRLMNKQFVHTGVQTEGDWLERVDTTEQEVVAAVPDQNEIEEPNEPLEANILKFNKPLNLQGVLNEDKMFEYHMRLNELINIHKNKTQSNVEDEEKINLKTMGKQTWTNSNLILMFLENTIKKHTRKPTFDADRVPISFYPAIEIFTPKLMKWQAVKDLIWEIYDHRILHAPEINGTINSSYMTLNEHLLVFMMERYKNRPATEKGLVQFLASLKYYCENWQRAKFYAQIAGFLTSDDSFAPFNRTCHSDRKLPTRLNDGKHDESDTVLNDIYLQEYYLYCYNMIVKDKSTFIESKEGYTYFSCEAEEKVGSKVLCFLPPLDVTKWSVKVRRTMRKLKTDELQEQETEYTDIDQVLSMYLDEFKTIKQQIQKKLQKNFTTLLSEKGLDAPITTEIIDQVTQAIRPHNIQSPVIKFPGPISNIRALLYAFMCGGNNNEVNELELLAGCNRYGIENPIQVVTRKLAFYGNEDKALDLLKQMKMAYGVDSSQFAPAKTTDKANQPKSKEPVDLKETKEITPKKQPKFCNISDIKLLSTKKDAKAYEAPAEAFYASGVKIRIKDLQEFGSEKDEVKARSKVSFTSFEVGVQGDRNIIVPSFGTTTALFARHFQTLRLLKRRCDLLKQSYYAQMDEKRSWQIVEQILEVLERGFRFLATEEIKEETQDDVYEDDKIEEDEKKFKTEQLQKEAAEKAAPKRRGSTRRMLSGLSKQNSLKLSSADPVTPQRLNLVTLVGNSSIDSQTPLDKIKEALGQASNENSVGDTTPQNQRVRGFTGEFTPHGNKDRNFSSVASSSQSN